MSEIDRTLAIQSLHDKLDRLEGSRGTREGRPTWQDLQTRFEIWKSEHIQDVGTPAGWGKGGGGGEIESRLAKLEAVSGAIETRLAALHDDVREIRSDIKTQFMSGIGAVVFVLAVWGAGYVRVDDKVDTLVEKIVYLSGLLEKVEKK